MKLNSNNLSGIATNIITPKYDRDKLVSSIVHIGVGGFHRAHQCLYLDEVAASGDLNWGLCGVGLLPHDVKMRDALKNQDYLYTLVERSTSQDSARIIGSIKEFLFAPENPELVLKKLSSPEVRIVSLTVTEGGYNFDQGTGEFITSNPDVQHDLKNRSTPKTVFGYIIEALARRKAADIAPFTILSCDNLQSNGDVARKMFLSFAELRDSSLAEWISANVAFPNSMVDRITPAINEEDKALVAQKFNIEDSWPVVCEPFRQWVIEDNFCNGRPALEKVGAQMTKDVHPYETMKIRLLNAGHSTLGYLGYLAGFKFIYEITEDPEFQVLLKNYMDKEVTPLLDPVEGVDFSKYKASLVERFANKTIKDQALRICMDGSAKMPKFILPTVRENLAKGGSVKLAALTLAAWFRFLNGTDEKGQAIPLQDPMAEILAKTAKEAGKKPQAFFALSEIFGDLGQSEIFVSEVESALDSLYAVGARKTLQEYLKK